MRIRMYQVDAFSGRVFAGNPAAVCPLTAWLSDEQMQSIAAENNLSETAFFVEDGSRFQLRWFTPLVEVDLCGHATLASAFVILDRLYPGRDRVDFETRSGHLGVKRHGDRFVLDLPARPPSRRDAVDGVADALGASPREIWAARDEMMVFDAEHEVRALQPDMTALAATGAYGVIATAPGTDCDFVSRFVAPAQGIPEDPVTGSAHCTLTPYWAQRLGKSRLFARQLSQRGGELWCCARGDRVEVAGEAALSLEGTITV